MPVDVLSALASGETGLEEAGAGDAPLPSFALVALEAVAEDVALRERISASLAAGGEEAVASPAPEGVPVAPSRAVVAGGAASRAVEVVVVEALPTLSMLALPAVSVALSRA